MDSQDVDYGTPPIKHPQVFDIQPNVPAEIPEKYKSVVEAWSLDEEYDKGLLQEYFNWSSKFGNRFVCNLCYKDALEIGLINDGGYYLMHHEGAFKIISGQGHNDSVILTFNTKPSPSVIPLDTSDEEMENLSSDVFKKDNDWMQEAIASFEDKFSIETGYHFMKSCMDIGYGDDTPFFQIWIYDVCGKMIEQFEKLNGVEL